MLDLILVVTFDVDAYTQINERDPWCGWFSVHAVVSVWGKHSHSDFVPDVFIYDDLNRKGSVDDY